MDKETVNAVHKSNKNDCLRSPEGKSV